MNILLSALLTLLINYGYPILAVVIFSSGLGAPLPATTLILAAGSLTVDHTMSFPGVVVIVAAMAILTDCIGYAVAHYFRDALISDHPGRFRISKSQLRLVDSFFKRYGGWTIFFSRWLVTPLGFPVNLIAGFHRYSLKKFIVSVIVGESVWALLYTYIGYVFGASWPGIVSYLNGIPQVLALLSLGVFAFWAARKLLQRRKDRHTL